MTWIKAGSTTLADTVYNWNDSTDVKCVISGNVISPDATASAWNSAQAKSSTGITRGGEMSFIIHTSAEGFGAGAGYWGIDEGTTVLTGTTGFDYYMYIDGASSNVVAYDSNGNSSTTYAKGDTLTISIDASGNVLFKNNGTTFRTSSVTAGTNTYYAQYLSLRSGSGGFGGKGILTSGAGDNIDSGTITANKFNQILSHEIASGNTTAQFTFNGSTGNEYASRWSNNGGSENVYATQSSFDGYLSSSTAFDIFNLIFNSSIVGEEKLSIMFTIDSGGSGAGNAPLRAELVSKYVPSSLSTTITKIECDNTGSGSFDTNSNLTVIGSDGVSSLGVQDGAVYYETDTNKEYVLYNNAWTEV